MLTTITARRSTHDVCEKSWDSELWMEMKSHEVWEEHLNQSLSPEVAFGRAWRRDLDHAQGMVATPTQNSWGIIATASTWNKRNTQQLRRKVATYYVLISFTNPECRPSEWRDNEFQSLPNTQINSRGRLQHIYWTHSIITSQYLQSTTKKLSTFH